jgi:membrane protease YdiL (CAAX protease family)
MDVGENGLASFFSYAVLLFCFNAPAKPGNMLWMRYLLSLGAIIFVICVTVYSYPNMDIETIAIAKQYIRMFWVVFAVVSLISGWLAYYTYIHYDEVLSRRMLWRNSRVSIFEYRWIYTLDRFCSISVSIVSCVPCIGFMILWWISDDFHTYIQNLL